MSKPSLDSKPAPLTTVQWLICTIAAIGFAFDIYELLMLPLIARPALLELGGIRPGTRSSRPGSSLLFYIPAVAGGIFGLLGGYLTDRLGRRRVLTWSILLYAFSALRRLLDASTCCSSFAASCLLACASNLSPRSPGWPNCFPTRNGASRARLHAGVLVARRDWPWRSPNDSACAVVGEVQVFPGL